MADWDVFDSDNFEDDEYTQTPLNAAMEKIIIVTEQVFDEMKEHLRLNENSQFNNKLTYILNRLSQLTILAEAENNPDYTQEEIDKLVQDAELRATEINYDMLNNPEGEEQKKGLSVIDYIDEDKGNDPFDFDD